MGQNQTCEIGGGSWHLSHPRKGSAPVSIKPCFLFFFNWLSYAHVIITVQCSQCDMHGISQQETQVMEEQVDYAQPPIQADFSNASRRNSLIQPHTIIVIYPKLTALMTTQSPKVASGSVCKSGALWIHIV